MKLSSAIIYGSLMVIVLCQTSLAASIDTNNFQGCFVNNYFAHEFNIFVSHLTSSSMTPANCLSACNDMGYYLASIESGQYCFCKSGQTITSSSAPSNTSCQVFTCSGDANFFCGSSSYMLVYFSIPPTQVGSNLN